MRFVVLTENTSACQDLCSEHGLSLYIEAGEHKILFDFGQSDAFLKNAEKLGIDLSKVDFAVLSHGHYDHGGGISSFLEINSTAPVFVSPDAFAPHYNASGKYIGLDPKLSDCDRFRTVYHIQELAPGITLVSGNQMELVQPIDSCGMTVLRGGAKVEEDFSHELYLILEENGKRICVSGCSHKGIVNIVHYFRPDVLIGGFHFMKLPTDSPVLLKSAQYLMKHTTRYYTCHCTGQAQYNVLKSLMGDQICDIKTGSVFEL